MDLPDGARAFLYGARGAASVAAAPSLPFTDAHATVTDVLLYAIAGTALLELARLVLDRFALGPLSSVVFARARDLPFVCDELERAYVSRKHPISLRSDVNTLKAMTTSTGKSLGDLQRWITIKISQDRLAMRKERFLEAGFRLVIYTATLAMGFSLATSEDAAKIVGKQAWEVKLFFIGLEIPLYVHLLGKHVATAERGSRAFYEYLAHHGVTLCGLSLCYLSGYTSMGVKIILAHDITDVLFESAKLTNVSRLSSLVSDALFMFFTITWCYSRLYLFGYIYLPTVYAIEDDSASLKTVFMTLLSIVFALNVYWFRFIIKMALRILWIDSNTHSANKQKDGLSTDDDRGNNTMSDFYSDDDPLKEHEE